MLWPNGTTEQPTTSSSFGPRNTSTKGASSNHLGWDSIGYRNVCAIADGTVVEARVVPGWTGGGLQVWVQHEGFFTRSMHLASTRVKVGQEVKAGDVLGVMGMTGVASGTHLHLEVSMGRVHYRNAGQIDPVPFIQERIDMPLSDADIDKIARRVWERESAVNKVKWGDMLRVVFNSIRWGSAGNWHHGTLTQAILAENAAQQAFRLAQGDKQDIDVEALAEALAANLNQQQCSDLADEILKRAGEALTKASDA